MFPANSPVIRLASAHDAHALRLMARIEGRAPLTGRILVAVLGSRVVAAISRDEQRVLRDPAVAPPYVATVLRLHVAGLDAAARQPDLGIRVREALLGRQERGQEALAA